MDKFNKLRFKIISKRVLQKLTLGERMAIPVAESPLKEHFSALLTGKGRIYAFYDKKELIALFGFAREEAELDTLYVDMEDTFKKEREEKRTPGKASFVYKLKDCFIVPAYAGGEAQMKKDILADLKEQAVFNEVGAIIWGEEIMQQKKVKVGSSYIWGSLYGFAMGILFGILFDNIALGICFGLCFASAGNLIWSGGSRAWEQKSDSSAGTEEADAGENAGMEEAAEEAVK